MYGHIYVIDLSLNYTSVTLSRDLYKRLPTLIEQRSAGLQSRAEGLCDLGFGTSILDFRAWTSAWDLSFGVLDL